MKRRICDFCNKNDADKSFKVKKSKFYSDSGGTGWTPYWKIDICPKCYNRMINYIKGENK